MAIRVEQLRREFVVGRGRSRKVIPAVDSISFQVEAMYTTEQFDVVMY